MKWKLKPKVPEEFIKKFPEYPSMVLQLLYDRGLDTQKKIDEFFNPDYLQDLHDPFLMLGMKEAVECIVKAIGQQKKIVIYGDYDCDGICGAVILEETLNTLGADSVDVYIPNRLTEGYGLNKKAIEGLRKKGVDFLITVDCGVANSAEIDFAKSLGMEVIVTDHHEIVNKLPQVIVINPHQAKDTYPFRDLAGAGVAFKLAQALIKEIGGNNVPEGWEKWLLDLVALATVADMVPLLGENRTLVKYGLVVLAQTKRVGLKKLMEVSGLEPVLKTHHLPTPDNVEQLALRIEAGNKCYMTNLSTHMLGFLLAPRLNVAGRMKHANIAYQLLIAKSEKEAEDLAKELDSTNRERQQAVDKIIKEIENNIAKKKLGKIIFESSADWPVGLNGLIASKLKEKYSRPSIILNIKDGLAKGSARSFLQFNIVEAIAQCKDILDNFGGHMCAAGCRLKAENLEEFKERLERIADDKLKDDDLVSLVEIDCQVLGHEIDWQSYDWIQRLAPFGKANPPPLFMMSGAEIVGMRTVGNSDKHLKLELRAMKYKLGKEKNVPAIGFNHGIKYDEFKIGDKVDVVFEFLANEWNGNRELQLKIIDIKQSELSE